MILADFLKLPTKVSFAILNYWLPGYSITRLHAACCGHRMRANLLHLSSSHALALSFIPDDNAMIGNGLLSWALCRNTKLTTHSICQETDIVLYGNYLYKFLELLCIASA